MIRFIFRYLCLVIALVLGGVKSYALTPVTGTFTVCVGANTTLMNATPGGTWSSSTTAVATVDATTGDVHGVTGGTATITYTSGIEFETATVTVTALPVPGSITGTATVCAGATTTLSNTVTTGTWLSTNTATATIDASGNVTGVSAGIAVISYTVSNACGTAAATRAVSVTPLPNAGTIAGPVSKCVGDTVTMVSSVSGGTWSSSMSAIGAVNSTSGLLTAVSAGTVTITYTYTNTCGSVNTTSVVSINPAVPAISGPSTVCRNDTVTLTDATSGGTWNSTSTNVYVDAVTGQVAGITNGTARISYSMPSGCSSVVTVTVNNIPSAIVGNLNICKGANTTLTDIYPAGTWTSSDPSIANPILSTGGTTHGFALGTATISYTLANGCSARVQVTVHPVPDTIEGPYEVCRWGTTLLTNPLSGGTWTSTSPGIARVDTFTGSVYGVAVGNTFITYKTAGGCLRAISFSVNPVPTTITGALQVCEGSTGFVYNTLAGGTWASSDPAIAGVLPTTGMVAGIAPGTATITYEMTTGCSASAVVTINPLPAAVVGASAVCEGATTTFTNATSGGTWASSTTVRATVDTFSGDVTGVLSGTAAISYILPTGCRTYAVVTVNTTPGGIAGSHSVCEGLTSYLSTSPGGGVWTSADLSIATIGSAAGVVSGVAAGTTDVTYTLPGTGCYVAATVTVDAMPSAISGPATVCVGTTGTYTSASTGGSWSVSTPSVATVDAAGTLSGITAGTVRLTYTVSGGCITISTITVNPMPSPGSISGFANVCAGATISMMTTIPGGTWTTANGNASVDASGVVTGVSGGWDTVQYQVTNACGISTAIHPVNVLPLPDAGSITGDGNICLGSTRTLAGTISGGVWSTADTTVSITGAGLVSGLYLGTATISYTRTNACGSTSATTEVTVHALVDPGMVTGTDTMCYHDTVMLSASVSGGMWVSDNVLIAVVDASGTVASINPGTATIMYIVSNSCSTDTASHEIAVRVPADCLTEVGNVQVASFSVYPNPTSGTFTIATPSAGKITLWSADGRAIAQWETQNNAHAYEMPSGAAAGMYLLRFSGVNGATETVRLLYRP